METCFQGGNWHCKRPSSTRPLWQSNQKRKGEISCMKESGRGHCPEHACWEPGRGAVMTARSCYWLEQERDPAVRPRTNQSGANQRVGVAPWPDKQNPLHALGQACTHYVCHFRAAPVPEGTRGYTCQNKEFSTRPPCSFCRHLRYSTRPPNAGSQRVLSNGKERKDGPAFLPSRFSPRQSGQS